MVSFVSLPDLHDGPAGPAPSWTASIRFFGLLRLDFWTAVRATKTDSTLFTKNVPLTLWIYASGKTHDALEKPSEAHVIDLAYQKISSQNFKFK